MISIIVPVFNVQNYIRECLDSILNQTYKEFELILIDDGSTDNSGKICDEYLKKDSRIKVIHKKNGGLSSARNCGLEEAKGDYICFVDSDDSIKPDYLEKLDQIIEDKSADLVLCDVESPKLCDFSDEIIKEKYMETACAENVIQLDRNGIVNWLLDDRTREYVLAVVAWNKIYSRHIFDEIRFLNGKLHEDEFLINEIINLSVKVFFIHERLYNYRDNEMGITGNDNKIDIRHLDVIEAYDKRVEIALSANEKYFAARTLINALNKTAKLYRSGIKEAQNKYIQLFGKYKDILSAKQKVKYLLFILNPKLFSYLFL